MNKEIKRRDDMHRCPICLGLFNDSDCVLDPEKGYLCPRGCENQFIQPAYQSPLQDIDAEKSGNNEEML